jgi:putative transposase
MGPRSGGVAVGDQVRFGNGTWTVRQVARALVVLADVAGTRTEVALSVLLADPSFGVVSRARGRAPLPARGSLEALSADVAEKARCWEADITEVLRGVPAAAPGGTRPRAQYDPASTSLRQRQVAKVAELAAADATVSLSKLLRMCRAYEREGVLGLVDGRSRRRAGSTVDPRVVDAVCKAIDEQTDRSTGTVGRLRRRVGQILTSDHELDPDTVMPSRATFYRLVERLSAGRHTFGSAPTRRSLAQQPDGPFGMVVASRPGEWVLVDSTPLDVRVVLDDGTVDRAELTWMIDAATRSIPAAVLRPTTKTIDASLLLARCLTPEPMRPGWSDALRLSRSALPFRRLLDIDARLEHAAARPVIAPETIVCDHGMVYLSASFRAACRALGVSFQPTHAGCPWEKGIVERSFASMATLFAQYVKGYVGRSVDRRGKNADADAAWSISELQALLDEWIVAHWQNRPHDGLRHPMTPGTALTPNEMYAALVEVAGCFPVPLTNDDYIELLPVTWRAINSYGVKISHRRYDAQALNPYRRQHSGVAAERGRWEVHYDPYDVSRIWVRNHHGGGWLTATWTHLNSPPVPFGEQAWQQAQQVLARRGQDSTNEAEIAAAVAALLDKAEAGPTPVRRKQGASKRDSRVAARTRATNGPVWPRPADDDAADGPATAAIGDREPVTAASSGQQFGKADSDQLADVIPLAVFNAREEAKKRW